MKKIIVFLLFLVSGVCAQHPYTNPITFTPFKSGSDTVGSLTDVDTVEWQVRATALNWPAAWNQFSTYITGANKTGEQTVVYELAQESKWTYGQEIRFRIVSPSGTITGDAANIANRLGALTLFVQPDTVATDTTVYLVRLVGQ